MKMVRCVLALTLLFSTAAHGYPIDLELRSQGLDVEALPELLGVATVVRLINHEVFPVRCDVRFNNGPEIGRVRKVTVRPGDDHIARFTPSRQVIRLKVTVECWPAEQKADDS